MAQSVEQLIRNQQVAGSSPASSSIKYPVLYKAGYFFILSALFRNYTENARARERYAPVMAHKV